MDKTIMTKTYGIRIKICENAIKENEKMKKIIKKAQDAIDTFDELINDQIERIDMLLKNNFITIAESEEEMDKLFDMQQAVLNVSKEFAEYVKIRQEKLIAKLKK